MIRSQTSGQSLKCWCYFRESSRGVGEKLRWLFCVSSAALEVDTAYRIRLMKYVQCSIQSERILIIYNTHPSSPQGAMSRCSNLAMRSGSHPDRTSAAALPSLGLLRVLQRPSASNEYCLHCMSPSHLALQSSIEAITPLSESLSLSQPEPEPGADILGRM